MQYTDINMLAKPCTQKIKIIFLRKKKFVLALGMRSLPVVHHDQEDAATIIKKTWPQANEQLQDFLTHGTGMTRQERNI